MAALRAAGVACELEPATRSLKAVLKRADRLGATRLVLVGEQEAARGVVTVKDLRSGEQREATVEGLAREIASPAGETEGSAR